MITPKMIATTARRIGRLLAAKAVGSLTINSVMPLAPQHHLIMQRVAGRRQARHRALGTGR